MLLVTMFSQLYFLLRYIVEPRVSTSAIKARFVVPLTKAFLTRSIFTSPVLASPEIRSQVT